MEKTIVHITSTEMTETYKAAMQTVLNEVSALRLS